MAKLIETSLRIWTQVGPRKNLLGRGAHWRNLVNTTEPSMYGGDAACCQITFTTYLNTYTVRFIVLLCCF